MKFRQERFISLKDRIILPAKEEAGSKLQAVGDKEEESAASEQPVKGKE